MKHAILSASRLALLFVTTITTGCSFPEPNIRTVGRTVSSDGKRVLTLYAVVPGSILDDYLALNLARPGANYSPEDTLASFSKASDLRVFWTKNGRPALHAKQLEGVVFVHGKPSELIMCENLSECPARDSTHNQIAIDLYPTE